MTAAPVCPTLPRAHRCCVSHTDRRVTPRVHLRLHGSELTLCLSWVLSAHPPAGCNVTHLSALQIPTLLSNRSSHTNSEKFRLTFRAQGWLPPSLVSPPVHGTCFIYSWRFLYGVTTYSITSVFVTRLWTFETALSTCFLGAWHRGGTELLVEANKNKFQFSNKRTYRKASLEFSHCFRHNARI